MAEQQTGIHTPSVTEQWFGLLGGAVAWTVHLMGVYALGEFGCVAGWAEATLLGINAVAWGVLGLTVLMTGAAVAATYVAYRNDQRLRGQAPMPWDPAEGGNPARWMSRAGWITSAAFAFTILFETVPVFYFLRSC